MIELIQLSLENYKPILNGMGLYSININFVTDKKLILLKGNSGIGKSTIQNAIIPLPDSNELIIEDMQGKKELLYTCTESNKYYKLSFLHPFKNGKRAPNKAYFYISDDNSNFTVVNDNGNIGSFKDCLEKYFKLSVSFLTFSKITNESKGIVDKTPAERKKYFNSFLRETEIYNSIFDSVSTTHTELRALMKDIKSKMDNIGPSRVITNKTLEKSFDRLSKERDSLLKSSGSISNKLDLLDKDNKLAKKVSLIAELKALEVTYGLSDVTAIPELDNKKETLNGLKMEHEKLKNNLDKNKSILELKKKSVEYLYENKNKLQKELIELESTLDRNSNSIIDELEDRRNKLDDWINKNKKLYLQLNVDRSMNTKEFIDIVEFLHSIRSTLYNLIEEYSTEYCGSVFKSIMDKSSLDKVRDLETISKDISTQENYIYNYTNQLNQIEELIERSKELDNIPKNCKVPDCYFIRDLKKSVENIDKRKDDVIGKMEKSKANISKLNSELKEAQSYIDIRNVLNKSIRLVGDKFNELTRLKSFGDIPNAESLIGSMMNYDDPIYKIIDKTKKDIENANIITEFHNNEDELKSINKEISMMSKALNENLEKQIKNKRSDLFKLETELVEPEVEIDKLRDTCNNLFKSLSTHKNDIPILEREIEFLSKAKDIKDEYYKIKEDIEEINKLKLEKEELDNKLDFSNKELEELKSEISKNNVYIEMLKEYKEQYETFLEKFKYVDTIRKYSNPKGMGIQVIYMIAVLSKIINSTNTLLENFFDGQFKILYPSGYDIDELNIPCKGKYSNYSDISNMSFSQRCMISMLISISLFTSVSEVYKIVLLDEIDSGLDTNHRSIFSNSLMRIMEQENLNKIIITSHNLEFDLTNCEVINLTEYKVQ